MYTDPKIISTDNLKTRAYITFYLNGERYREYNGNKLNISLHPNRATTITERTRLLKKLLFEFQKGLENGWSPLTTPVAEQEAPPPTYQILNEILNEKQAGSLSTSYKRDLKSVHTQFFNYLTDAEKQAPITEISVKRVEAFLSQYDSTGTYYMNKRRALRVLFSSMVRKGIIATNPVDKTVKRKAKTTLHRIYRPEQVKEVLRFLKRDYPNLHLCCLLTYGCLLRPHQESRLLKKHHFNEDLTKITLSGDENKSGRIRTVHIPEYVRQELLERDILRLGPDMNIISRSVTPYNVSYFSLQWSRAKKKMSRLSLLDQNQTIYSFRHSAAINIYKRSKDIHILQQLLGHSNMIVTLKYLRGLGELNDSQLKASMPEL